MNLSVSPPTRPLKGTYPTAEEVADTKRLLTDWSEAGNLAVKWAAVRIRVTAEIGRRLNKWRDAMPHGQWEPWLAANFTELKTVERCKAQRLAHAIDVKKIDLRNAPSLHRAYILAGVTPSGAINRMQFKKAKNRLMAWARTFGCKMVEEDPDKLTEKERVELKGLLKPIAELWARL